MLRSFSGHLKEFFCPGASAIQKTVQNVQPLSPHLDRGRHTGCMRLREGGDDRESSKAADLHQSLVVEKYPSNLESEGNGNLQDSKEVIWPNLCCILIRFGYRLQIEQYKID